jgi:pyruvate, water dikinase
MTGEAGAPGTHSTGWAGLDRVLGGLARGDNVVWSYDSLEAYRELVQPYSEAARLAGFPRVYFRFASHEPLLEPSEGLSIHHCPLDGGFEEFVRHVHGIIEAVGPGAAYIFDSISDLAGAWFSDLALGNFFVLTCPRLRALETFTYFGIRRDAHSNSAIDAIRQTTQFFLEVFTTEAHRFIRPLKVQYRSAGAMNTLHMREGDELQPVEESAILARILGSTRGPHLNHDPAPGFWNRLSRDMERALEAKELGVLSSGAEAELMEKVRAYFRVHRSGIAPLVEQYLGLEDFYEIRKRQIGAGSIGGKAFGMLVARAILRDHAPHLAAKLESHDSFFVGAEVFVTFLVRNGVWWIREKQSTPDGYLQDLEEGRARILQGGFPPNVLRQFADMLEYFGEVPCIVRSSSILEDARGNAFSGKYESIFLTNGGSLEERMAALLEAIRRVYASVLDPEALRYRRQRQLLDSPERMALLIMRVSGRRHGRYFFPQSAGVGLSYNPYRWDPQIDSDSGVVRLVFGLGTRAVDRADDDYTRLVALNAPLLRPEASLDEQLDHSQRRMDLLDLESRKLASLPISTVLPEFPKTPLNQFFEESEEGMHWPTFAPLLRDSPIPGELSEMLQTLEAAYQHPVDIEFTINLLPDGTHRIHLLQCRTFQVQKGIRSGEEIDPAEIPGRRLLCARGGVIGLGRSICIRDLLYVPAHKYAQLSERDRYLVAKRIERLVELHDPARPLLLVGPGRWGTSSPSLGIPVRAGRIAQATAVCEVVAMHGGLIPDVSLGTHFFNDLVEHDLLYLACFPGKPGNELDEDWILDQQNHTARLSGKNDPFSDIIHWLIFEEDCVILHADPFFQSAVLRLREGRD